MENKGASEENKQIIAKLPPLLKGTGQLDIKNIRDAKDVLSKLIRGFCRGEIEDTQAKTLCYLLTSFVNISKEAEIEVEAENNKKFLPNFF
ncbi:MAG: hypothetical protein WCJ01_09370 [Ignavibacteria bacterium]